MAEGSGASSTSSASTSQSGQAAPAGAQASNATEGSQAEASQKAPADTQAAAKPEADKAAETKTEPTETAPEPPKKHKYADRLTKAFPDRKFESDADYDSAMDEHLESLEGYREKGQIANKKLMSVFDSEPVAGKVVQAMINGATFREALARYVSPDDLSPMEGDPDYEGWNNNKTEREKKAEERKKKQAEFESNMQASEQEVAAFAEENGLSEDDVNGFLQSMDEMMDAFHNGKVTKDMLALIRKGRNYDSDLQKARGDAAVVANNKKIIAEKEAEKPKGDGLPRPGTGGEVKETERQENYFERVSRREGERRVFK